MTVKELIEELQKMPQDKRVFGDFFSIEKVSLADDDDIVVVS